ncbi:hypothetical protein [Nostoc sp. FACHB-190]|uniref:hypothetical protein n=1 Tax=Nostoc sp. FACHB-190 TaxID=2692838 RepID=UPI001686219B|nr:hypothetical protein [Nostoc sp. FACHB-190]MBD2300966.1 hypothetical protein [Nostoc sp. FACHB-190]
MKCPVCGAVYRPVRGGEQIQASPTPQASTCRRCKADLSDLLRLYDQAIWHHKQALDLLSQKRYSEAATYNNQALALHYSNADFHALAGKLSALQGKFREAISSWQQALKFDSQNAVADHCLQLMTKITENYYKHPI